MPTREENKFLSGNKYYKKSFEREIGKKHILLGCCICFVVTIIIYLNVLVIIHHFRSSSSTKICKEAEQLNFPKNISEFLMQNQRLCERLLGNKTVKEKNVISNPSHIYIINNEKNLTDKQACGIESILRLFPDKTIYLVNFHRFESVDLDKTVLRPTYLQLLLYLYKDRLQLIVASKNQYFKGTPFCNVSGEEENFNFLTMLVTAYKYGGFVVTPDVLMTSREFIECFPEDTIVEPFSIVTQKRCDESLYYLMESLILCGRHQAASSDQMLTKSAELYTSSLEPNKHGIRRMKPNEVCSSVKQPCHFIKLDEFKTKDTKWICDLSSFCKQVVQAFLGIKLNQLEVEEETDKMKSSILSFDNRSCAPSHFMFESCK